MFRLSQITRIVTRQLVQHKVTTKFRVNSVNFSLRNFSSSSIVNKDDFKVKELIAAQDPDTFGTLSPNTDTAEDELVDEGDIKEDKFISNRPLRSQKLSTKQYADMIKEHFRNRRVKEALDVLEVRMLKEDRVKPENYIFNLLIDGCAREGFTKKAFNLFTKMRQRGLKVTGATYTSLFNACSNAPWKNDGLSKARRLREIMIEKGYEPNAHNYHAMIKAFGRCQDIETAFLLVDEMQEKNVQVSSETFNFLLQACISDREFGFRHALLVWHKMYQRQILPDIYSFNLMLLCCRDCELGDIETTEEVFRTILLRNPDEETQKLMIGSGNFKSKVDESKLPAAAIPNLIALKPHLGDMVELNQISTATDRFLIIGGYGGFLDLMKQCNVTPNLHTFTELLEVIPSSLSAEKRLLNHIKKYEVKCDVDFFNVLMKKRCLRYDYDQAREVLEMIETVKLKPDIVTYGVLALTCQTHEEAIMLIKEMHSKGIKMNIEILGAMFKNAAMKRNFTYALEVLRIIRDLQLKPSEILIENIDKLIKFSNREAKKDLKYAPREFREELKKFKVKVARWKSEMGLDKMPTEDIKKVVKDKPWEQFQQPQAEGYEDVKGFRKQHKKKYKRYIGLLKDKPKVDESQQSN